MIRHSRIEDRQGLVEVCLLTGDGGKDGSAVYRQQPGLLAEVFVLPYLDFCPEFALTLELDGQARGYCLAAPDSAAFYQQVVTDRLPQLRALPRLPDAAPALLDLYHLIDHYQQRIAVYPPCLHPYPAHLHIDLHPLAQGAGWGPKLVQQQLCQLAASQVRGVHLGMHPDNARAGAFYRRLGFRQLQDPLLPADTTFMVKTL